MILLLKNVGQDEIKLVSQLVPSIKHSVFLPFLHTLCKVSQILIIINFQTKQVFQIHLSNSWNETKSSIIMLIHIYTFVIYSNSTMYSGSTSSLSNIYHSHCLELHSHELLSMFSTSETKKQTHISILSRKCILFYVLKHWKF